jgi:hypothetical protein
VIRFALFLLIAGSLAVSTFWLYLRAELPVRRNRALAGLRATVFALVALLLLDPAAPWGGGAAGKRRWVLLDVSLSMNAGDGAAWAAAQERAGRLERDGWDVVRFGSGVETGAGGGPDAAQSRLGPALARAVESGAGQIRVLSDLRFDDPVAVRSALSIAPGPVDFEGFGGGTANAGIASFDVEDQLLPGDSTAAEVEFFATGEGDSLVIEVREEGRPVAITTAPLPAPGLRGRAQLELPPPSGTGRRRYTAAVRVSGDGFTSDDEAVAYMSAGHDAGGLVVVSVRPDWEARALLTVLERATGLRGSGYLRVGPDRFLPMGPAVRRGSAVDSATVGVALSDAALAVIHGLADGSDVWSRSLPARAARSLLWPADDEGAAAVGVATGPPRSGEWYATPELPASPLAGDLSGARLDDLPPLGDLLPLGAAAEGQVPLLAQLGGTGPAQPTLLLRRTGGRRSAVVLAAGFWRWYAREGSPRDTYRRLWSGVSGWLLQEDVAVTGGEARPEHWVFRRGEPVRWRLPGVEGDSARITVSTDVETVYDGTLPSGSTTPSGPLPPGTYRYRVQASDGSEFEGRFDVESRTLEMLPAPFDATSTGLEGGVAAPRDPVRPPISTTPWPFLMTLALLCIEWVWRRRVGLR